jgi:hypothetical protein
MAIIVIILFSYIFCKKVRTFKNFHKALILFVFIIYIVGLILYLNFLEGRGWTYGIPGADMLAHYQAAERLAQGASWRELSNYGIGSRFEFGINTVSYFIYSQFLSWLLYYPVFIDIYVNMYMVYILQCMVAFIAIFNYSRIYKILIPGSKQIHSALILLFCVAFAITSYQLMRDVYLMWLISEIFCLVVCEPNRKHGQSLKTIHDNKKRNWFLIIVLTILCVLIRIYSIILILPFVCYYTGHKKLGTMVGLVMSAIMIVGLPILYFFNEFMKLTWNFGTINPVQVLQFLVFPNIVNQSKYILNWNYYFAGETYLGGCNGPGVYYLMSLWNLIVLPLAIIGIIGHFRRAIGEKIMWLTMLLNIAMLYSISYDSIDNRQKLMMILQLCFFAIIGINFIQDKLRKYKCVIALFYSICMFVIALLCFMA